VGEGSPAEQTGLLKNDIIVSFDGEEVESFDQLKELMTYYEAGETVKLEYYRLVNGEYTLESVELVLGNRNAN
jgi:serine protease Do